MGTSICVVLLKYINQTDFVGSQGMQSGEKIQQLRPKRTLSERSG
jgi:hypothetical protein